MMNENYCPLTIERHFESFQDIDPVYNHLFAIWQTAKDDLTWIPEIRNVPFDHS